MDDMFRDICEVQSPQYTMKSCFDPFNQVYVIQLSDVKKDQHTQVKINMNDFLERTCFDIVNDIIKLHLHNFEEGALND